MTQFVTSFLRRTVLAWFDSLYLKLDHALLRRAYQLHLIPNIRQRTGGKIAYSEHAYTIGVFQSVIMQYLSNHSTAKVLDVGCGTGLLGIACYPLVQAGAQYTGIDVKEPSIAFAKQHFPKQGFEFHHVGANNPVYASSQTPTNVAWEIADNSQDMVTALSVWTHFNETDAHFYLSEVARVLKPDGHAVITFFIMDDNYQQGVTSRRDVTSKYHGLQETRWIFDSHAYESEHWHYPSWAQIPEEAIGVTREGLDSLLAATGLELVTMYAGNWREQPAIFFQDILIFRKPSA